jgi:PAS domain S-box-containing protein
MVMSRGSSSVDPLGDHFAAVVLELAPDGIAVTDEFGRILHANGRFEHLFGFSRDELVGHTVEKLLPERVHVAHRNHRRAYEQNPAARAMGSGLDLRAQHANGTEFAVEVALSPVSTANGLRTIMAVRPVDERRAGDKAARDRAVFDDEERIAAGLNDGVIRPLFAASLELHGLRASANEDQAARLDTVITTLDDAIRAMRTIVFDRASTSDEMVERRTDPDAV